MKKYLYYFTKYKYYKNKDTLSTPIKQYDTIREIEEDLKLNHYYLKNAISKGLLIEGRYIITSDKMTMQEYNTLTRQDML